MSDSNDPPRPDGPADEPAPPSSSGSPPPTPPPPPPPAAGEGPYGAPDADDPYGAGPPGGPGGNDPYGTGPAGGPAGSGYGAPPPTGGPYYGQPGQPRGYQATEAIAYGWKKFMQSPNTLLVPTLMAWVGIVVVGILVYSALLAASPTGFYTRQLVNGLAEGVFFVIVQLLTAGLYRGALRVTDGQDFHTGELFQGYDKGQVVVASLLIAIGTAIGTVLCVIPGLIVGFLTFFTLMFVVDKQMQAVDAIKASYKLVTENLANTLLFWLLAGLVLLVSACICGIGLLVGIPVALLALAYTYRQLHEQPVSPAG